MLLLMHKALYASCILQWDHDLGPSWDTWCTANLCLGQRRKEQYHDPDPTDAQRIGNFCLVLTEEAG